MKTIIRKRLFCIVLACCFLQLCLPLQQIGGFVTTVFAAEEENVYDFAGGTGTMENPYKIETMFHLNNVRHYLDAHFIQMNDIDLTEATADNGILGAWQSIGTSSDEFTGSYDGGENVIKGLQGKSLFKYIGENGVVQNLGMVDGKVFSSDDSSAAGIAQLNYGTISNCYNTGNATATSYWNCYDSGGIAGSNYGTISNCYNIGNVASLLYSHYSGGIAGSNYGTINNCYNTGNVTAKCDSSGGIAGENSEYSGVIENCYTVDEIHLNDYGTKLTVGQMKQQDYFTGFDFNTVWIYDTASGYPFPVLKNIKHIERQENNTDFQGGNGTFYNPYLVATEQQLDAVRNHLHDCFMQVADIDLTEETSESGIFYHNGNGWTAFDTFTGNYNGNTHTITGLKTKGDGLFDGNNGIIKNLGMVDGNVTSSYSGSIVGRNEGTISNCYNMGNVTSSSYSGGIAGRNEGTISNCYNTGNVTATTNFASSTVTSYSGGIAGYNDGTIRNCYNTGTVTATSKNDTAYAGGLVGRASSTSATISTSYSMGEVSATGATTRVGKVIGMNEGATLSHLYYIGTSSDFGVGNEGNGKDRVEFRTAEQMKTPSSLTGFDFEIVWAIDETINNGFPFLYGVGNSLTPPSELPKSTLERNIDNVSYDSGKQAYTFTIAFENNTNHAITTNVFAAAYDNSGRMTGLSIYDLTDLAAGNSTTIDAVIPAPQTAAYIKIICMDINTLVPVGMTLKEEM